MRNVNLTAEQLRMWLHYEPSTGVFTWRIKPNRRIRVGDVAGTPCRGRWQIKLGGTLQRSHRLAWLYMYGEWPKQQIDHINGNPSDNRICNLRDVSSTTNHQNQRRAHKRNKLGILGVSRSYQKKPGFRARIDHVHLGTFETPELAHAVYLHAKRSIHDGNTL